MKQVKYQNQLNDIKSQILDEIWKIFNKYEEDGELSLEHNDEGIDLDYIRYREHSWEQYNDEIIAMDKDGELYTEWDKELNIYDFNACELMKLYEEILNIYKDEQ